MRAEAWRIAEPSYIQRSASLADDYRLALSRNKGSDSLEAVARAAVEGRVAVLIVEDDCQLPWKIDSANGELHPGDLEHFEIDDALDDLAEIVLRMKREVVVVPKNRIPSETGLVAIYRY